MNLVTGHIQNEFKNLKTYTIMTIKPLADRVLVLPAQAEEKVGGIIIPDTAKEKPQRGKVVAVSGIIIPPTFCSTSTGRIRTRSANGLIFIIIYFLSFECSYNKNISIECSTVHIRKLCQKSL